MIIFGKKITKANFFFKKSKSVQTNWFRFGSVFLEQKPVPTCLTRFFRFGSVFFDLARFRFYDYSINNSINNRIR